MKIGVISDIHGNQHALKVALARLQNEGVNTLFVLGDLVGYYYGAEEVLELLDGWETQIISGNHERIFLNYIEESEENKHSIDVKYGSGFKRIAANRNIINFIKALPEVMTIDVLETKIVLSHGSPWNKDLYIYPDKVGNYIGEFSKVEGDIVLMGHTHYPMSFRLEEKLIINVGSIGQSRLYGSIVNWGVLNFSEGFCVYEPRADYYDTGLLKEEINLFDPQNSYLSKILDR